MRGYLALKDFGVFSGEYFGGEESYSGEIAFFRSRDFCSNVLTDPAYHKKIVITDRVYVEDKSPFPDELYSFKPHLSAIVFLGRVDGFSASNGNGLRGYLALNRVGGFIPHRRDLLYDALNFMPKTTAAIDSDPDRARCAAFKPAVYLPDDVDSISAPHEYLWDIAPGERSEDKFNIIVWDFGTSFALLKRFRMGGCRIRVVPPKTDPEDIVALHPDGIIISGSPVSPEYTSSIIPRLERIIGIRPLLGVGGGAITLARALGAEIMSLAAPHHGTAVAVENVENGLISATYQTHNLAPLPNSVVDSGCEVTHINVCDESVEAFYSDEYRLIGSMYTEVFGEYPRFLEDFRGMLSKSNITV